MAKFKIKRQAASDFTESGLPHNRKEVFFDSIKLHWLTFLKIGCLLLASMLPLFAICIVRDNLIADALNNLSSLEQARYTLLLFDGISIPLYLISAFAFSGAFRVVRKIAWAEFLFFGEDFKEGIKLNYGLFSKVFLLVGAGIFCVDLTMLFSSMDVMKGIPLGLSLMLLLPIAIIVIVQATIYNIDFFGALKNALFLFAKSVLSSVACSLAVASPMLMMLISNTVVKHICLSLYMLIVMPYVCLGVFLAVCSVLDKYINAYSHPEIVGKGICIISEVDEKCDEDFSE